MPKIVIAGTRSMFSAPPGRRGSFHHGDLRNALLTEALAGGALESVSLRQLAASVGVSPAAVYRHFAGKDELLGALAGEGFDRLRVAFGECFDIAVAPRSPVEALTRLRAIGTAYLRFADDEPALWRLMFGPLAAAYRSGGRPAGTVDTFDYLSAALLGLHRCDVLAVAPDRADTLFAWSVIHGLASLRSGKIPLADGGAGEAAAQAVDRIVAALRSPR